MPNSLYEQILRVPYYVLYDRYSNRFRVFCLQGARYVELNVSGQGFWFEELGLGLGIWTGAYCGVEGQWLRWYDGNGNWVGTDRENLIQATQSADEATQAADRERTRADLLAAKLRELGIDVDSINNPN